MRWLLAILVCIAASAAPPARAWQSTLGGVAVPRGWIPPAAIVLAPDHDLLAVGSSSFVIAKLAPTTGKVIWRHEVGGGAGVAVAVDAAGDVVAVGGTALFPLESSTFTVVKLAGATGAELWHRSITGTATGQPATPFDVAVDSSGDVLVAGLVNDSGVGAGAAVVKLAGADGMELWRHTIDAGAMTAVRVDPLGDVVALASLVAGTSSTSAVIKLSGMDGGQVWRADFPDSSDLGFFGRTIVAIALEPSGDVAAAGFSAMVSAGQEIRYSTRMLSGADGATLWQHDGVQQPAGLVVPSLALGPSGDAACTDVAEKAGSRTFRPARGGTV